MKLWSILQESLLYMRIKHMNPIWFLGKREGIKVSFITDTRPIEAIEDFIEESDLFICEGTYGDDRDAEKAEEYAYDL